MRLPKTEAFQIASMHDYRYSHGKPDAFRSCLRIDLASSQSGKQDLGSLEQVSVVLRFLGCQVDLDTEQQ